MRREPRVVTARRLMAHPPRQHDDRFIVDAAWIAWSIAILLWIGAMTGGLKP